MFAKRNYMFDHAVQRSGSAPQAHKYFINNDEINYFNVIDKCERE